MLVMLFFTDLPLNSKISFRSAHAPPNVAEKQWYFYEFMDRERNMFIVLYERQGNEVV